MVEGVAESQPAKIGRAEAKVSSIERFKTAAGNVEVTDIAPEKPKDLVPILLASGWGETPTTHKNTLATIYASRRRGIAIKYPRTGGVTPHNGQYPQAELRKAKAILGVLGHKGIEKVDIIAHSEGALNVIIAANLDPGRIRNVVFVDPAGLIGNDNLIRLAGRFTLMLAKDILRNVRDHNQESLNRLRAANEAVKYFGKNPRRGIQEAQAISQADIYEMLTSLKEMGIGISIIHGVGDTVFPFERLIKTAKEKGGIDTIGFYSVKGDHREISVNPERYTALAIDALENLARLRTSRVPAETQAP